MTPKKWIVILLLIIVVLLVAFLLCRGLLPGERGRTKETISFYDAHRLELQAAQLVLHDLADAGKAPILIGTVSELGSNYQNDGVSTFWLGWVFRAIALPR